MWLLMFLKFPLLLNLLKYGETSVDTEVSVVNFSVCRKN